MEGQGWRQGGQARGFALIQARGRLTEGEGGKKWRGGRILIELRQEGIWLVPGTSCRQLCTEVPLTEKAGQAKPGLGGRRAGAEVAFTMEGQHQ